MHIAHLEKNDKKIEQGLQDRKKKPICFSYRERITVQSSAPDPAPDPSIID
jgi:hypothetical protein